MKDLNGAPAFGEDLDRVIDEMEAEASIFQSKAGTARRPAPDRNEPAAPDQQREAIIAIGKEVLAIGERSTVSRRRRTASSPEASMSFRLPPSPLCQGPSRTPRVPRFALRLRFWGEDRQVLPVKHVEKYSINAWLVQV